MSLRTAIILAAGSGSKFWPYATIRQKATFPIANVPLVRRLVDDLHSLGLDRIIVVVGPGEASVRAALRGTEPTVELVRQSSPTGTADAVLCTSHLLDGPFLVVSGDVATDPANLSTLRERFTTGDSLAAALVQPLGDERPQDWLIAHLDGEIVHGVEGHPRGGTHRLAGIYAFQPECLPFLRDNPGIMSSVPVGGMPPAEAEIAQSLQLMLDEGETVMAVETTGHHVDVDKPWHILAANNAVINRLRTELAENVIHPTARIHDGAELKGRIVLGENAVIGNRVVAQGDLWLGNGASVTNGAMITGPAVIGPNSRVRDYCQIGGHSSLGPHGVYGHGAEFAGVALERVYCYHYCEIWGVVGQAVDFGAATVCGNLRFDDSNTSWQINGRRETPPTTDANAAYFGDFCRTGVNAIIMPGRRVGIYACVGPGVILQEDLPDRQLVLVDQQQVRKSWGPEKYGW